MKAKTKLTKLWSFLLSLVMLFSLLPTTAFAAGNYPDSVTLYNGSGKIIGLSDGQYLAANGDYANRTRLAIAVTNKKFIVPNLPEEQEFSKTE